MVNNYIYAMLEKGSIHCQKVRHYDYWEPFPPTREVNLDAVLESNLVIRRHFHSMQLESYMVSLSCRLLLEEGRPSNYCASLEGR